jgi:hypothetical protein
MVLGPIRSRKAVEEGGIINGIVLVFNNIYENIIHTVVSNYCDLIVMRRIVIDFKPNKISSHFCSKVKIEINSSQIYMAVR